VHGGSDAALGVGERGAERARVEAEAPSGRGGGGGGGGGGDVLVVAAAVLLLLVLGPAAAAGTHTCGVELWEEREKGRGEEGRERRGGRRRRA